ncbi:hypothetical protein N9L26_00695 [Candidatus Pacebacteria bacterium]|nr:hypothetical protein [Candidatus Paceibacterota bacterium]
MFKELYKKKDAEKAAEKTKSENAITAGTLLREVGALKERPKFIDIFGGNALTILRHLKNDDIDAIQTKTDLSEEINKTGGVSDYLNEIKVKLKKLNLEQAKKVRSRETESSAESIPETSTPAEGPREEQSPEEFAALVDNYYQHVDSAATNGTLAIPDEYTAELAQRTYTFFEALRNLMFLLQREPKPAELKGLYHSYVTNESPTFDLAVFDQNEKLFAVNENEVLTMGKIIALLSN